MTFKYYYLIFTHSFMRRQIFSKLSCLFCSCNVMDEEKLYLTRYRTKDVIFLPISKGRANIYKKKICTHKFIIIVLNKTKYDNGFNIIQREFL